MNIIETDLMLQKGRVEGTNICKEVCINTWKEIWAFVFSLDLGKGYGTWGSWCLGINKLFDQLDKH